MKSFYTIHVRAFPVLLRDERTGEEREDTVVLTKQQLQAAQIVGQSSKELIFRICNAQGYRVLDIGKADKQEITLRLDGLYEEAVR